MFAVFVILLACAGVVAAIAGNYLALQIAGGVVAVVLILQQYN